MADSPTLLSLVSHLICISIANSRPFMDLLVLFDVWLDGTEPEKSWFTSVGRLIKSRNDFYYDSLKHLSFHETTAGLILHRIRVWSSVKWLSLRLTLGECSVPFRSVEEREESTRFISFHFICLKTTATAIGSVAVDERQPVEEICAGNGVVFEDSWFGYLPSVWHSFLLLILLVLWKMHFHSRGSSFLMYIAHRPAPTSSVVLFVRMRCFEAFLLFHFVARLMESHFYVPLSHTTRLNRTPVMCLRYFRGWRHSPSRRFVSFCRHSFCGASSGWRWQQKQQNYDSMLSAYHDNKERFGGLFSYQNSAYFDRLYCFQSHLWLIWRIRLRDSN